MFTQPSSTNRTAPGLGGSRLQNGKLGSNSSWLASGALSSQPRAGVPSFAQTISGQQAHASLDPSEFPSLGTAPAQQSNAQSTWFNQSIRTQPAGLPTQQATGRPLPQSEASSFGPGAESYRFGAGGGLAGLAQSSSQPQSGGEEFPPLGRQGADGEGRSGLLPGFGGQGLQVQRPGELDQGDSIPLRGGDREAPTPRGRTITNPDFFSMESSKPQGLPSTAPIGYRPRFNEHSALPGIGPDSPFNPLGEQTSVSPPPAAERPQGKRLSEMSWRERNGLKGLAARLDPDGGEFTELAVGADLGMLGLNFDGDSPLYSSLGTPFGPLSAVPSRPAVPDYRTPDCYRVHKVPPLDQKINSFSDEALFCVFYSMPRDFAQERAAEELFRREWRWNMSRRFWMRKDDSAQPPIRISQKAERGIYIVWNPERWERQSQEILLNYEDLEQRFHESAPQQQGAMLPAGM